MSSGPPPDPGDFPRGGAGPPQALPSGANFALLLVSAVVLLGTLALLGWLLF